jgi:hypothetical protein
LCSDVSFNWIAERTYRKGGLVSNFLFSNELVSIIKNLYFFFKKKLPDRLVFGTSPHKIETYILAKIAEMHCIPILFGNGDPITKRATPVMDINEHIDLSKKKRNYQSDNYAKEIINKLRKPYQKSMPDFLKEKIKKNNNNYLSLKIEFEDYLKFSSLKKIFIFYKVFQKIINFNYYRTLTNHFMLPKKYIVYFLHYQPERTSTPDGGIFSAQLYNINLISMAIDHLKLNIKIVVKEHPTQFRNKWNTGFRDINFYKQIKKLNNTIFAPLNMDPTRLIDKSLCTSSINGTCLFEAAARGKSVICFGYKSKTYKWHNCFNIDNIDNLCLALKTIIKKKNEGTKIVNSFQSYLSDRIINSLYIKYRNTSFELFEYLCTVNIKNKNK